mgnify:CR=1 FL=1
MKDRNFVKEIEKLRTAVLGYDREEVVLYIRELVEYYGQKNEEAVRELYLEKMQLAAENAGLRAQIPTQEKMELIRSAAFILTIYRTKHCVKKCSG